MNAEPAQGNWTNENARDYSLPKANRERLQKFVNGIKRLHRISNIYWLILYGIVAVTIIVNMLLNDVDFLCSLMAILSLGIVKLMLGSWKLNLAVLLSNTYCENEAACEAFSYLCQFQVTEKNRWSRKVQYVSCLLNVNEKEKAKEILADGRNVYPSMRPGTQMLYDFLWSSYFFECKDKENFEKSVEYFKTRWISAPRSLVQQKSVYIETLALKDAILNQQYEALRAYCNVFKAKIEYPFDYYKYHYYLGLCEAGEEKFEEAKGHFEILRALGEYSAYFMDDTVQRVLSMENVTATDQRADAYRVFSDGKKKLKKLKTIILMIIAIGVLFYLGAMQSALLY